MRKKILLLIALCACVGSSQAGWSKIEHSDNQLALYVDDESRTDRGHNMIVIWHLVDYAAPQDLNGKAFRSAKAQFEYDCNQDLTRVLMVFWHPDPMGNSQMVNAVYKPGAWSKPVAGSIERTLIQHVCKKN